MTQTVQYCAYNTAALYTLLANTYVHKVQQEYCATLVSIVSVITYRVRVMYMDGDTPMNSDRQASSHTASDSRDNGKRFKDCGIAGGKTCGLCPTS